ncbi:tRNA pseudouridine(38-40) synthase TruA [Paenibacillus elgii]|uniref:tRNA pseudouridine(38-40) synthase TruA n=1 Tax=Paenibacillus elgii TaxID=189691 RepID=UPI002D7DAFC6|nr:tRNA pseudouridine(38-40) synthase TruA [Paenibacillus elgii]
MRNICMTVSYNGASYHGFQTQPQKITIQQQLEQALCQLTLEEIKVTASGRTDAGVHARGQVFNFQTGSQIPIERWCMAMNSRLPDDIVVWDAMVVPDDFHARRSAKRKTYRYTMRCGKYPDLFKQQTEFHHPTSLDITAMQDALSCFVGEHDFTSFCSSRSSADSHVRTIFEARLECEPMEPHLQSYAIHIYLTGSGFLYNMVRIIVGTLIEVGEGKRSSSSIRDVLAAKDRAMAGPTAMAHGLMLWEVFYGKDAPNA